MKRILVIRKHNHLGDMLCSLPLYEALKRQWPYSRITLLAAPTSYPVPLIRINPFLDEVVYYDKASALHVLRLQLRLRRSRFDLALVPSTIRLSATSHITARLSGAPMRVGVRSIDGNLNAHAKWLTHAIDAWWEEGRVHQVHRNLEIAAAVGCSREFNPASALRIAIAELDHVHARSVLSGLPSDALHIGVHPGAGKERNIWPTERFIDVLRTLRKEQSIAVLVTAGTPDADVASRLVALLESERIPCTILRDADIPVLASAAAQTDVFLSNDTGTMHVAAFGGARVVSLFGPTPAWEWAPLHEHCAAIQSHDGSMVGISTDEVVAACRCVLSSSGRCS
jgi:ADP-heptose:LPS heptosyltransferase